MGISNKSHGNKSDKECQSPMLKLFRDMTKNRDKDKDPEKTNLLKSKAEKKKKKESRSKSIHKSEKSIRSERRVTPLHSKQELKNAAFAHYTTQNTKSDKSMHSERHAGPLVNGHELRNTKFEICRAQSAEFEGKQNETCFKGWFWGEPEKPDSEETCSCVSCALKKILSTDYACIVCIVTLFIVSVVVAFLLLYKSVPSHCSKQVPEIHSEQLNKVGGEKQIKLDRIGKLGRLKWDDEAVSSYGIPQSMDFQDLSSLVDSGSELSKILDTDKISEIEGSDRLREFYKKLIQTDAQIQNLKKNDFSYTNIEKIEDKYKTFPDRAKRSLKIFHKPVKLFNFKKNKKVTVHETNRAITKVPNITNKYSKIMKLKESRNKRFDNVSEPAGIIIEKKKFHIEYGPNYINRKSKCSHTPTEIKSHEYQLKHPFYQNTQRLDELLDMFLENKWPGNFNDQFGLDLTFDKEKNKCKHPKTEDDQTKPNEQTTKQNIPPERILINNNNAPKKTTDASKNYYEKDSKENKDFMAIDKTESSVDDVFGDLDFGDINRKVEESTENVLMSISTLLYGDKNFKKRVSTPPLNPLMDRVPNIRKLLQADVDNNQSGGSKDIKSDADNDEAALEDISNELINKNSASILNPNWKGPMPLYSDELNSMIKEDPIIFNSVKTNEHNKDVSDTDKNLVNRVETPVQSKDSSSEKDDIKTDFTDMEYIEDYFHNKYDRLVELAQAYSDYGVLDGKKTETDKKEGDKVISEDSGNKVTVSPGGFKKRLKDNIPEKSEKGNPLLADIPSEGFRIEIKPKLNSIPSYIKKQIQKHVMFSSQPYPCTSCNKPTPLHNKHITDNIKIPDYLPYLHMDITDKPAIHHQLPWIKPQQKTMKHKKIDKGLLMYIVNGKRTLQAVDLTEDHGEDGDDFASKDYNTIHTVKHIFNKIILKYKRDCGNNSLGTNHDEAVTSSAMKVAREEELSNNNVKNLIDFFILLSNCFSALYNVNIGMDTRGRNSSSPYVTTIKTINKYSTTEISLPILDSGIIDNIGHRSRLLLSVNVNVTNKVKNKRDYKESEETKEMVNDNTDPKKINMTTINNIDVPIVNINENKTKLIVKRNIDDTNLIFPQDIYDDEYGVAMDHFENNIRDKHSVEINNILKKPNEWLRNKVRKITDGIHKKVESFSKKHKIGKGLNPLKRIINKKKPKNKIHGTSKIKSKSNDAVYKRTLRNAAEVNPGLTKKTDFTALTANMKKVCRKTAEDLSQTKDGSVTESKTEQVSSSLIQRLIRLISDVVDFQVQHRICRKLPPDLQNFLEWLTNPESDSTKSNSGYTNDYPETVLRKIDDKSTESIMDMASPSEREDQPEARSDCFATLQAVQDLMRQYDDMTDDDKRKMINVKDYLESQLNYLQKKMSSNNEYSIYDIDSIRLKRDTSPQTNNNNKNFNKKTKFRLFNNLFRKKKPNSDNTHKTTIKNETITNSNENAAFNNENNSNKQNNNNEQSNNANNEQSNNGNHKQSNNINYEQSNNGYNEQNNNGNNEQSNNGNHKQSNNINYEQSNNGYNEQNSNGKNEPGNNGNAGTDTKLVKEKINLRDVYNKAIEDAKKITTIKTVRRFNEN